MTTTRNGEKKLNTNKADIKKQNMWVQRHEHIRMWLRTAEKQETINYGGKMSRNRCRN